MPVPHGPQGEAKCDGCLHANCMPSETWHCDHRGGHECDGSACEEHGQRRGGA